MKNTNSNEIALNMIAEGVTKTRDIANATGLSVGQVRHRFMDKIKDAKRNISPEKPIITQVNGELLSLVKSMQKDMKAMRKEVSELKKAFSEGKWFKNPYLSGSWDKARSECTPDNYMFHQGFTGENPWNCLVEVELGNGDTLTGLAYSFDWRLDEEFDCVETVDGVEIEYREYLSNRSKYEVEGYEYTATRPRDEGEIIVRYKIMQTGN